MNDERYTQQNGDLQNFRQGKEPYRKGNNSVSRSHEGGSKRTVRIHKSLGRSRVEVSREGTTY